jgi:tripartite-type tricarboxylate transporter receptor subunit TctC
MQITRVLFIAFAAIGVSADRAWSQASTADYPTHQVNLVVPFAPGGGTDILGRLIGQKLSDRFGKPFVVENRPGAGTVTAAVQVAKSPPDGYTIMMATSGTMAMNTTLYKKLPYDPGKDLVLVALVCNVPFVLVVNPALPVNSVADLVKLAKAQPLSYGSGGAGAFHHLMGELFKTTLDIPMTHVPYKGTLPALNDVIAGHIQLMFSDLAPAYPLIQAGKVRALGVTTAQRAGHPAARRSRRPRLRLGGLAIGRSAGRNADGDRRQTQRRSERGRRRARGRKATYRPSVHSARQRLARGARPLRQVGNGALGQGPATGRGRGLGVTAGCERGWFNSPPSRALRSASIWRSRSPRRL